MSGPSHLAARSPELPAPDASSPRPGPWSAFGQAITRFDRAKIDPWLAIRNALGVGLALGAGIAFGRLSAGLILSTGALNVAFSDSRDPYLQRVRRMLAASVLVAIAVFGGSICGHNHVMAVTMAAGWAFAAGMPVALSTAAADLGAVSLVVMVVYAAFPMAPYEAALSGLLAFAGGVLETVLAVLFWPLRRYAPERQAVGQLYAAIARAAAAPTPATDAPPATAESTQAQNRLATLARDHSIEAERYRVLLTQAERVRLSLLALARLRTRIGREDQANPVLPMLDRYFELASHTLTSVGNALLAGQPADSCPKHLEELQGLAARLRQLSLPPFSPLAAMLRDARFQMDALAGQLRSAADLAGHTTPSGLAAFEQREAAKPWTMRLGGTLATLHANLSLRSAACRHATRLAACIAMGETLARGFNWGRSYWLPMTIAIVLKPDFTTTFSRGVLRLAGTFIGLLLATVLFHVLHPSVLLEVVLISVFMFIVRCWGLANYGVLATAMTALVVVLVALSGDSPRVIIAARAWNTLVGGVIALVAYWVWPTWERNQVPETMARLLDGYRDYFRTLRESRRQQDPSWALELDRARLAGRLARSNLEASVDRLLAEPGTSQETVKRLAAIMASTHRLAHALMSLEAALATDPVAARDAFQPFADHVELTLYYLAAALRGASIKHEDLPDLREDHHVLVHTGPPAERYALVNTETDRITNSLNTLSEEIPSWLAATKTVA